MLLFRILCVWPATLAPHEVRIGSVPIVRCRSTCLTVLGVATVAARAC
jgi:hypothetical protein